MTYTLLATAEEALHGVGYVYGLIDPDLPDVVRYVGRAREPVARLRGHLLVGPPRNGKPMRVTLWISEVRQRGGPLPAMVLLERVADWRQTGERERFWCEHLQGVGQADLNGRLPARRVGVKRRKVSLP